MCCRKNFANKDWVLVPKIDWEYTTSEVSIPVSCLAHAPSSQGQSLIDLQRTGRNHCASERLQHSLGASLQVLTMEYCPGIKINNADKLDAQVRPRAGQLPIPVPARWCWWLWRILLSLPNAKSKPMHHRRGDAACLFCRALTASVWPSCLWSATWSSSSPTASSMPVGPRLQAFLACPSRSMSIS